MSQIPVVIVNSQPLFFRRNITRQQDMPHPKHKMTTPPASQCATPPQILPVTQRTTPTRPRSAQLQPQLAAERGSVQDYRSGAGTCITRIPLFITRPSNRHVNTHESKGWISANRQRGREYDAHSHAGKKRTASNALAHKSRSGHPPPHAGRSGWGSRAPPPRRRRRR